MYRLLVCPNRCIGVLVYWCIGVLVCPNRCIGVLVYWCIGVLVYRCIGVLVYWCIVEHEHFRISDSLV